MVCKEKEKVTKSIESKDVTKIRNKEALVAWFLWVLQNLFILWVGFKSSLVFIRDGVRTESSPEKSGLEKSGFSLKNRTQDS